MSQQVGAATRGIFHGQTGAAAKEIRNALLNECHRHGFVEAAGIEKTADRL